MHYLLIILLMITPMRGVLASSLSHCDMSDMDMSAMNMINKDMINKDGAAMTMMHEHHASAVTVVGKLVTDKQMDTHNECCCCDGNSCTGNCDMGMSVSILMLGSSYTPGFVDTKLSILSTSSVLAVALTPPSRPPALLS